MTTLSTGFAGFDECLDGGLHSDGLVVIAGAPASGKTSFVRWLIKQALRQGLHAHLVDMEDTARSTFQSIGDEARFTYQGSWSNEVYDFVPEVDLLVVDNLHMAYVPEEDGRLGSTARWMAEVARRFQSILHENRRAVTILTTHGSSHQELPAGLAHTAGVVFHTARRPQGTAEIKMTKNRYGSTGIPYELRLPDLEPLVRRTLWERLLEEV